MKKAIIQFFACWIILSFFAVVTADYWRNPNAATMVFVEIEPKKGAEKTTDSKNDLKEDLKGKFQNHADASAFAIIIAIHRTDQHIGSLPAAHFSLPDLPPELV